MKNRESYVLLFTALLLTITSCSASYEFDIILRGGTVVDGSGDEPYIGDVAIVGDKIVFVGNLADVHAPLEIDANGLAIAPGFINMMSWANESLLQDGRSLSDIHQGVTLEVMGEGSSMGPLNDAMSAELRRSQGDIKYEVEWTTLDGYLSHLVNQGVSTNVASFVGATSLREFVVGHEDRQPTPTELDAMRDLLRQAMEEGALGLSTSLIYPPGEFADTRELIELAKVAQEYGGIYTSHLRSEGSQIVSAVAELIQISRDAKIPAEIYHIKASGHQNWTLFDSVVDMIESARAEGLRITADVYPYPASATGLNATIPPWVKEGGFLASIERMKSPEIRRQIVAAMNEPSDEWENYFLAAGSPENILLVEFKSEDLKHLTGKTLAQVATERGTTPQETILDLIIEDGSRIGAIYFVQSEEIVRRAISLPWVSFNSDSSSLAPEGVFLKSNPHPRAYGSFARVLAKYVRDEKVISLAEAVRKLSALPASNLSLDRRGRLEAGYFADVVVFDPASIQDNATFVDPHQLATGMLHVIVNGELVLQHGEHTGAKPGRVVRGPGWRTSAQ